MTELQAVEKDIHGPAAVRLLQRQLQRTRPTADAAIQALDLLAVHRKVKAVFHQGLHFVVFKGQLTGVQR